MKMDLLILEKKRACFSGKEKDSVNQMYDMDWENPTDFIAYGLGNVGTRYINIFRSRFHVKYIVDNQTKRKREYCGVPVMTLQEMITNRKDEKIIVFASRESFNSIRKDLSVRGLVENRDFCKFDDFIRNWYWQFEHKNCLREVHTVVNTNCTFRCKHCNMFMPYYKKVIQYDLEKIKSDLSRFFSRIDYVFTFSFLGGEPFLNPQLNTMIEYLFSYYKTKVGQIEVITNGSLIPEENVLKALKDYNVTVRISNYTGQIPYNDKLNQLCRTLDARGICYSVEESLQWTDFCFPRQNMEIKITDAKNHMLCCAPEFHGLNDGKFFYCHVAWSAEKAGLIKLKEGDYISLDTIDPASKEACRAIVEHGNGIVENGYVSLCEKCMGCGSDNKNFVMAGEQISRKGK